MHDTTATSRRPVDGHGNPVSATTAAVDCYDRGVDQLLHFDPAVVDTAGELADHHAGDAISHMVVAYLTLMSTDQSDVDGARESWQAMSTTPMNEREAAHHRVIGSWLDGDWAGASAGLDDVLVRWPTDLLALSIGHQLDFFLGDAHNLRDRAGRALGAIDPQHPHTGFVLGMQAFGLEESGHYEQAEDAGMRALATNADDVWAIHAVVHTYEMRGMADTGVQFLAERRDDWSADNLLMVHNWWHEALFHLELGTQRGDDGTADALRIYDASIHNADSSGVSLEMVDASALLWRIGLEQSDITDGVDGRWSSLADAWSPRADAPPWYAFNDLHATMAFVGAGRLHDARAVVERLERYVETTDGGTNRMMTEVVGLPGCRAVLAYGEGRHDDVVELLAPIRRTFNRFGGSHAQRDVLQRTLLESSLRSGGHDLARALIAERLALRPSSAYAAAQKARIPR